MKVERQKSKLHSISCKYKIVFFSLTTVVIYFLFDMLLQRQLPETGNLSCYDVSDFSGICIHFFAFEKALILFDGNLFLSVAFHVFYIVKPQPGKPSGARKIITIHSQIPAVTVCNGQIKA